MLEEKRKKALQWLGKKYQGHCEYKPDPRHPVISSRPLLHPEGRSHSVVYQENLCRLPIGEPGHFHVYL